MNKLTLEHFTIRISAMMKDLRGYENIEIKLKDGIPGQYSILVKKTEKEDFTLEDN